MEFKEKNRVIRELANPDFIDADRRLLKSRNPNSELLSRTMKKDLDNEILYELLDIVSVDDIKQNRLPSKENKEVTTQPVTTTLKKNLQKSVNTLVLTGQTLKGKIFKKPS